MGRKRSTGRPSASSKPNAAPGSKIDKMERYEDTLEEGGVDDFMYKRDQIMFNPQNESDDEDVAAGVGGGDEVLSLEAPVSNRKKKAAAQAAREEHQGLNEDDTTGTARKARKEKVKPDLKGKGRFGKPIVDSDDEDADQGSGSGSGGSDEDDDEGWGRQYYSRPSTRREREGSGDDDSEREEEREMEDREVKRLQRKQREALELRDFGLDENGDIATAVAPALGGLAEDGEIGDGVAYSRMPAAPVPETSDPQVLLAHMAKHEPLKLALARELPHVVRKIKKTSEGIKKLEEQGEEGQMHKGLGWLHYQTLLAYGYTLAFYLHLCAMPAANRPDLAEHPILPRLLELKTGLSQLEDLDFDAAADSDGENQFAYGDFNHRVPSDDEDLDESEEQGKANGKVAASGGYGVMQAMDGEDDDDEWMAEGLENGELAALLADADGDDESGDDEDEYLRMLMAKSVKSAKSSKAKKQKATGAVKEDKPIKDKKAKKAKKTKDAAGSDTEPSFSITPLEEPEFVSSSSSSKIRASDRGQDDTLGDSTALLEADAADKDKIRRSLQFHTAKIAATSARREKARAQRLGGDEDIPYRDRQKARDALLRKNSAGSALGEDLEPVPPSQLKGKGKRSADALLDGDNDHDDGEGSEDAAKYYDLIQRRGAAKKARKAEEKEERNAAHFAGFDDDEESTSGGPRALTRAIEKNRGLTPKRNKAGRNPRVKKKLQYKKAIQKVGSQRSVFKGGQASLGGSYQGERTGISTRTKSAKF